MRRDTVYRDYIHDLGERMLESVGELERLTKRYCVPAQAHALMKTVDEAIDRATDLYVAAEENAAGRIRNLMGELRRERDRTRRWKECAEELFRRQFGDDMHAAVRSTDNAGTESPDRPTQDTDAEGPVDVDALLAEAFKRNARD